MTMNMKKLNVEVTAYEGDVEFPEAERYGEYVAGRLTEIFKCEVSVSKGPATRVFAYGFGENEESVVTDARSMVKVELWDDFCSYGYKEYATGEAG